MKIAGTNIDDPATSGRTFTEMLAGITKTLSPAMLAFQNGTDLDDGGNKAKLISPYAQSAWVYIAVSRLAEKVSSIPFRISRISGSSAKKIRALRSSSDPVLRRRATRALSETIIEAGDVVDLFNQPHPSMNRQLFWEMVVTWNCLRGEFFILPLDILDGPVDLADRKPRVRRLLTLCPDSFWHIVQGYDLTAWRFTGSPLTSPLASEMLMPSELIHSRQPNPYLFWRGMGPLNVAMVAAGADYAAAQYAKGYWLNNADTGVIVTTEQQADPAQRAAILAALRERKRAAGTADRPLFLWGGAKMEKPQLSGMEQQFIANREMNRQEIGAIYKVPESIMGFSQAKASALSGGGNAIEQEGIAFIENTISPLCAHIETAVEPIVNTFDPSFVGWFDVESLPVMQAARRGRLDTAVKAFAIGASFNDVNTVYDLGFEKKDWGDKSFLPFNLQEVTSDGLGANEQLPSENPTDPNNPDDEGKNLVSRALNFFSGLRTPPAEERAPNATALWKKHVAARKASVKMFQGKVGKVLTKYRIKALAKLDEIHLQKQAVNKTITDIIFSATEFGGSLNQELEKPLRSTLQLAGKQLNEEIGMTDPWEYPPAAVQEYLASRTQKIMDIGGTVRDQLNTSLMEGVEAGETHDQLVGRVKSVFTNLGDYEAKRVATTEVNTAYNTARDQAMNDAGVEFKAWLSSHGPHVRPAHAAAEEAYIDNPIPIDEPFEVGGEQLMFPGDDSLDASLDNIINCQCVSLAAQKKSEDDKSVTYLVFGFGEMKFLKKAA